MSTCQKGVSTSASNAAKAEQLDDLCPGVAASQVECSTAAESGRRGAASFPIGSLKCVVCGDVSSGKHYGVLACNGCSGFFKRSVRRKLIYRCHAGTGGCAIDKTHRNQCQACRLKRCLLVGMNKDAVQNERQPRNSAIIHPESFSQQLNTPGVSNTEIAGAAVTVGAFPSYSPSNRIRVLSGTFLADYRHSPEAQNREKKELSPRSEISLAELEYSSGFSRSSNITSPHSTVFSEIAMYPSISSLHESAFETSARILFFAVRWARSLPSYANLPFRDQVILLEETWSELFILSAIQWSLPLDSNPLFTSNDNSSSLVPDDKEFSTLNYLQVLQKTFIRFKMLSMDLTEFACLKAIILFKADAKGLKDAHQVEALQDHAQLMLSQHVKSQHIAEPTRFGRLLLLLPTLCQVPTHRIEAIFFQKTIGSTPMEKLLGDLFKC